MNGVVQTSYPVETGQGLDTMRFVVCGARGSGKSSLLGRLLYENKAIPADMLARSSHTDPSHVIAQFPSDMSSLVEGLDVENRQGTIDLTWRYFQTSTRKYIATDAPGHDMHVCNMVSGASLAHAAVVVVDAQTGILTRTRHQCYIASLMGVKQVLLAVNKMDLSGFAQEVFDTIAGEILSFVRSIKIARATAIPVSALTGANVAVANNSMPWHDGPTLSGWLEAADVCKDNASAPFRMPVQHVTPASQGSMAILGSIASGSIDCGMEVSVHPGREGSSIAAIHGPAGTIDKAVAGQSVSLELADRLDITRGNMLAKPHCPPDVANQFAAHLVWLDKTPMLPERTYVIRLSTSMTTVRITDLVHVIDMDTLNALSARKLEMNQVGYCKLATDHEVVFDAYTENRTTGSFLIIDTFSNVTAGAGVIRFPLRRAENTFWQTMTIDKAARSMIMGHRPRVVWLTGLSGAGKTSIADRLEQKLYTRGVHAYLLDGDNIRHGLNRDLGFTDADRVENVRRVAEVARLMVDAGLVVIVALISPFRAERQMARDLMGDGEFIEVFVDTPLDICEQRDSKGLYRKAQSGQLVNFTGIDSPYEVPLTPDIVLDGAGEDPDTLAEQLLASLHPL